MEIKYIVAIVALSLFFVLFLIFFILLAHRRKTEAKLQAWLNDFYSDKNLVKMDYDSASDEEEEIITVKQEATTEQTEGTKEEQEEVQSKPEESFGKLEIEGIEEITGNYEPEK